MVSTWKKKKRKTSKFVEQEVTRNERERNDQHGMGRQKNKVKTLGTERCANIETPYINN